MDTALFHGHQFLPQADNLKPKTVTVFYLVYDIYPQ